MIYRIFLDLQLIIIIVKKLNRTGSAENLKRKPRHCLIDDRGARIFGRLVNSDRKAPLTDIAARFNETRDVNVSLRTLRMRQKFFWLSKGVYKKKVVIKVRNMREPVDWCLGTRWRTVENLWGMFFSYESQVCLGQDHRVYVWVKQEDGWRPDLVKRRDQCPVQVMAWGVFVSMALVQ